MAKLLPCVYKHTGDFTYNTASTEFPCPLCAHSLFVRMFEAASKTKPRLSDSSAVRKMYCSASHSEKLCSCPRSEFFVLGDRFLGDADSFAFLW